MNYISTRNNQKNFTFKDVFLKGLADDGGLFVPKSLKQFKKEELDNLKNLSSNDLAAEIIYPFIGDFMSKDDLISVISKSYSNFRSNDVEENYWFSLNREDISKFTGKEFSKYIIYLDGNYQFPKPKKITANISNNHKKYAITWFSLAISILLLYLYFRKKNY